MIELVIASRCIDCDRCVKVCPTNVFDAVPGGHPVIARQQDCQTCFLCELYCPADALYVGPDCERPEPVDEKTITQTDWPQQYRRDSGWGKNRQDHPNEVWYMQQMLPEALAIRKSGAPGETPDAPLHAKPNKQQSNQNNQNNQT
jgi:NAD-dependent dihydropyrimidine dehydrogenase PreA subunit